MLDGYKEIVNARTFLFLQPQLAQSVLAISALPVDGNAIQLTVNDRTEIFEFDSNGSVTAGHIPVTIGADVAATVQNLQIQLNLAFGGVLRYASVSGYVYIISNERGTNFSGTTLSGAASWTTLIPQRPSIPTAVAFISRPVAAVDVTRGVIAVYTGIDIIYYVHPLFRVSSSNYGIVPWTGTLTVSDDSVAIQQGAGAGAWVEGNVLQLIVTGDKSE